MRFRLPLTVLLLLPSCAEKPAPVAVAVPPPEPVAPPPAPPPLPAGASPGMLVPAMRADGSYPTPNEGLSPAGALWHLRSGLNVAALACRGPDEALTVARYNALLAAHAGPLGAAERRYAAEWRAAAGDWRDRYDDAMTRLYNYWSQAPARPAFCAEAKAILAELAAVPPAALEGYAAQRLPALDRAFTDFYRAYDAWRGRSAPPVRMAAVVRPAAVQTERRVPWLEVDPAIFRMP